jgi:hypothetical protein
MVCTRCGLVGADVRPDWRPHINKPRPGVDSHAYRRAAMPNLNSGKDWSEMDLQDLRDDMHLGTPLEQIADFLMRDVSEVEAKIAELQAEQDQSRR